MADDSMAEVGRDGRTVIRTEKGKGRGAKPEAEVEDVEERYVGKSGMFDSLDDEPGAGPQRCEAGEGRTSASSATLCIHAAPPHIVSEMRSC
jgi:hypothetical protein